MVNKRTVMFGAVGGMTVGSIVPFLWGDYNSFGLMSVVTATIGGLIGIWLAVFLSKKLDL